jgi:predicted regulator of Ras-like GTPase activity (Roadblock/LC7/MglB family)
VIIMTKIFEQIRKAADGVVGSYIMDMNGDILANDVPDLFENELIHASGDLFQLIDIVKSKRLINNINIKADQGFIQLAINDNYILGTFTSKHVNDSLLTLVLNKAITRISPEDIAAAGTKA